MKLILFFTMLNSFFPILITNKFNILKTLDDIDHNEYINKIEMNYLKLEELVRNKFVYHYFQQDILGETNDYIYIFYHGFFIHIHSSYDYNVNKSSKSYRINNLDYLKNSNHKTHLATYIEHIKNKFYKSVEFSDNTIDNLYIDIKNISSIMKNQSTEILQSKEFLINIINSIHNNDLVILFDKERMEKALAGNYTEIPPNLTAEEITEFIINSIPKKS